MRRFSTSAILLLLCFALPAPMLAMRHSVPRFLNKETTVDMKGMNKVCVGWVDLGVDDWGAHGYATKTDWSNVIDSLNASFGSNLIATYLLGHEVVMAKSKDDKSIKGCDVAITFSDVRVDYNNYHLILGIHFIDPKTGKETGVIPVRPYYGNDWGLRGYLNESLKEVGVKLHVEISGEDGTKKGLMSHLHKDKDKN